MDERLLAAMRQFRALFTVRRHTTRTLPEKMDLQAIPRLHGERAFRRRAAVDLNSPTSQAEVRIQREIKRPEVGGRLQQEPISCRLLHGVGTLDRGQHFRRPAVEIEAVFECPSPFDHQWKAASINISQKRGLVEISL